MRICFVADARSPIARTWIARIAARGHDVSVISSHPVPESAQLGEPFIECSLGFASAKDRLATVSGGRLVSRRLSNRGRKTLRQLPLWLGPFQVLATRGTVRRAIMSTRPQLVHAMRLPFEGFAAAEALRGTAVPLVISTWGNDYTAHAALVPTLGWMTRRSLSRADALTADCHVDVRRSVAWGYAPEKPSLVVPGNSGVDRGTILKRVEGPPHGSRHRV